MASEKEMVMKQLNMALEKQVELEEKLKKVGDGPQAESLKLQYEKACQLVKHLHDKRIEIVRNE